MHSMKSGVPPDLINYCSVLKGQFHALENCKARYSGFWESSNICKWPVLLSSTHESVVHTM